MKCWFCFRWFYILIFYCKLLREILTHTHINIKMCTIYTNEYFLLHGHSRYITDEHGISLRVRDNENLLIN